jgi:hypothetical protein
VSRQTIREYEAKVCPALTPTFVRIANAIDAARYGNGGDPSRALAARQDELERMFGSLLEIVTTLVEMRTEFAEDNGGAR